MKYKDIKDYNERCDKHPDHQGGMISERMIIERLSEDTNRSVLYTHLYPSIHQNVYNYSSNC